MTNDPSAPATTRCPICGTDLLSVRRVWHVPDLTDLSTNLAEPDAPPSFDPIPSIKTCGQACGRILGQMIGLARDWSRRHPMEH